MRLSMKVFGYQMSILFYSEKTYKCCLSATLDVFLGCEARQFWLMSRHGTRNPGTEDMMELEEKLPLI